MKAHRLLFLLAIVMSMSGLLYPMHPDERVFIRYGQEMHHGKQLYVDLFDQKPPGIYLLAFRLGNDVLVYRIVIASINWAIAYGIYLLLKKQTVASFFGLAYVVLAPFFQGQFFLTETLVAWLAVYSWVNRKNPMLAGMLLGWALWFKQSAWLLVAVQGIYYMSKDNKLLSRWLMGAGGPLLMLHGFLNINGLGGIYSAAVGWFFPLGYSAQLATNVSEWLLLVLMALLVMILIASKRVDGWLRLTLLMMIPVLVYRPYHHYWIQILPFLLIGYAQALPSFFTRLVNKQQRRCY